MASNGKGWRDKRSKHQRGVVESKSQHSMRAADETRRFLGGKGNGGLHKGRHKKAGWGRSW